MQSIDFTDLEQLDNDLQEILDGLPERRRELHERIADAIKEEVDFQIANSGLNDNSGRIRDWQEGHVGSRGGYAAVRASDKSTGANSQGAITNYLENGHKIREPSGNSKNYRPRIRTPYVSGYHFYQSAKHNVERLAIAEAEKYVKEISEKLEG